MAFLTSCCALVGFLGACAESSRSPSVEPVIDTINGAVVVRNGPAGLWGEGEAWRAEQVFRLGAPDGPPELLFGSGLMTVSLGPHGNVFVLDNQANEVRVFDPNGGFLRRFGRPGRGPGELRNPGSLAWDPLDRLWIPETFQGRYTVFDSTGTFLKTVRRSIVTVQRIQYQIRFDRPGTFVDHSGAGGKLNLLCVDTLGQIVDSLSIPNPDLPPSVMGIVLRPGSPTREAVGRFLPLLIWTLAPDGTVWTAISDDLRLVQLNLKGDTLRIVETDHRHPTFTPLEQDLVDRARRELGRDASFVRQVIQAIHVLDDGHVLVQIAAEMDAAGDTLDVFDPEGRFLGSMGTGFALHPRAVPALVGDTLVGVTLGEFDVAYVVRATIRRGKEPNGR